MVFPLFSHINIMIKHSEITVDNGYNSVYNFFSKRSEHECIEFINYCVSDCYDLNHHNDKKYVNFSLEESVNYKIIIEEEKLKYLLKLSESRTMSESHARLSCFYLQLSLTHYFKAKYVPLSLSHAADAFAFKNEERINPEIYDKKTRQYADAAKSLLSQTDFKCKIKFDLSSTEGIAVFLDYLTENGENIILEQNGKLKLNFTADLFAENTYVMAGKIHKNLFLTRYLERLYDQLSM